jgi:hypothetical protein
MIGRVAAAALLAMSLGACASFEAAACGGPDDTTLGMEVAPPERIGGLRVVPEDEATESLNTFSEPEDTYQCEGDVYALRDGEELRAVFQVSRLAPDARLNERDFLRNLLGTITGSVPQPVDMEGVQVYQIVSNGQIISTWFHDHFMYFLTVREDPTIEGQAVNVDFEQVLSEALTVRPA